jgi:hypothetical protein
VQDRIRTFLEYKIINDKNQFMRDEKDRKQYYDQLPTECQRKIYTDFIYYDFLFKFRRFFSIRVPEFLDSCKNTSNQGCDSKSFLNLKDIQKKSKLDLLRKKISMITLIKGAY